MPKKRLLIGGAARLCSDSAPVDVPRDDSVRRLPIEPYTNIYMYIECDVSYQKDDLLLGPYTPPPVRSTLAEPPWAQRHKLAQPDQPFQEKRLAQSLTTLIGAPALYASTLSATMSISR